MRLQLRVALQSYVEREYSNGLCGETVFSVSDDQTALPSFTDRGLLLRTSEIQLRMELHTAQVPSVDNHIKIRAVVYT